MNSHHLSDRLRLGVTDVLVSPMGVGAWAWGDRLVWGYGRGYSQADLRAAFQASLELGVNLFDTAEVYGWGRSERLLGQFIREAGQQVKVATKFMPFPWRLHRRSVLTALRSSLDRLGLSRVDLYQIHSPFSPIPIETWMAGLAEAATAGLTRTVGVSNYNVEQTRRAHVALARRGVPLASNQVEYSLLNRQPERDGLITTCRELGITVIAYSPLGMGVLTGKYTPDSPPPGLRRRRANARYLARIQPLIALLREIGSAHGGKTPAQVALNWVLCKGALPIPGAKNAQQARENAAALGWQLTQDQVAALDEASEGL